MSEDKRFWDDPAVRVAAGLGVVAVGRALLARAREIDLHGKVVLITGSSRGLGLAMAREFAAAGARLVLCARDDEELERARADIAGRGTDVLALSCDVTDRSSVESVVARATEHFGRVDILVNNAGVIATGPVETMRPQDFEDALAVMFWGVVYATWAVLPQMRARHDGRIVNITSIGGKVAVPHLLPYCAAKFAATGLSEGLRSELAKDNIHVTTVIPGLMRTGSYLRAYTKGQHEPEFLLFGAVDNLPVFSISAENAARSIVRAARRGDAEIILSPQANALSFFHGLFPGAMADLFGIVNRFLPHGEGTDSGKEMGLETQERTEQPNVADPLGLGRKAAENLNQYPDAAG